MKVLFIQDSDDKYGSSQSLRELLTTLKTEYDVTPIVITSKKNKLNEFCDCNCIENYVTYHQRHTYINSGNVIIDVVKNSLRYLRYVVGKNISDLLINKLIDFREINIIHSNISAVDVGIRLSKKYGVKHVMHLREFGELDFGMKSFYGKNYLLYFSKYVDQYIAISEAIKDYYLNRGIPEEKIRVIYNGITLKTIKEKTKTEQNNSFRLIMSGTISEAKGQLECVNAVNYLHNKGIDVFLDIFGSGYDRYLQEIRNKITINHLEDLVKIKGYDEKLREKISNYDCGIICSKSEGFGRVTVEYMATGLPVIASNTGANIEIIHDGVNGYLYEYGNYENLAEKIVLLKKRNDKENMGNAAKELVKSKFTTHTNGRKIFELYRELV